MKAATQTHTFKTVGKLELRLDVHQPGGHDRRRGAVVWIHAGGLINGERTEVAESPLLPGLLAAGYPVVSIDYRLAPETKLPEIVADVEDAIAWVRTTGAALFAFDSRRLAVVGVTAGGYLALLTGHRIRPRPTAIVSLWGFGDILGSWISEPSLHGRHQKFKQTAEEAWHGVAGPPITAGEDRTGNGKAFYQFCRQRGIWPTVVSGWNQRTEAGRFLPYLPVKNITREYPPTLLLHGNADTEVPHAQSAEMAEQFRHHGVDHRFISVAAAEHRLNGGEVSSVAAAFAATVSFVDEHLQNK